MIFRNQIIDDERLDISKSFIVCYTASKLALYYSNENESISEMLSQEYFFNAIFRPLFLLLFLSKKYSYSFTFVTQKYNDKYIITNIEELIFNNPIFNFHENIIDINTYNYKKWEINNNSDSNKNGITLLIQNENKENIQYFDKESNQKQKIIDENECYCNTCYNDNGYIHYYRRNIINIFNFMNKQYGHILNDQENDFAEENTLCSFHLISKDGMKQKYLTFPNAICQLLVNTFIENKNVFVEIKDKMKNILFTPPYKILFGRINIYSLNNKKASKQVIENINETFYEGISNDI
ncbi:hypothetical protein M9Y10_015530 [Tritrichomonas musculus]|uniref:Uncharacterized protein n=1 Tax=Tritrichomonas musculus TaxID=1915356 RepID=A0ABR2L4B3_9EUKA